jgi:hypothetical protein
MSDPVARFTGVVKEHQHGGYVKVGDYQAAQAAHKLEAERLRRTIDICRNTLAEIANSKGKLAGAAWARQVAQQTYFETGP